MRSIRAATDRQPLVVVATLALAFAVAVVVKRPPPDFSALAPIATLRDESRRPLWSIRLAAAAHQIAVDPIGAVRPPAGRGYQLWLKTSGGAQSLGLLPAAGRKVIPEVPALAAALAGSGELLVTLEPARGSDTGEPNGPVLFQAAFPEAAGGAG
jgi:anti-sigma-K factor RskA